VAARFASKMRCMVSSMSLECWKAFFEIGGVIVLFLTFVSGAGVVLTSTRINARQAQKLKQFDRDLTGAKMELGRQQERAAEADERASTIEAGNLQLRTDLENATAESSRRQAELEKEQEKTALAQKEAAQAQLALKQYVDLVAKRAGPRYLDVKRFLESLRGKPKGSAELWYKADDTEAYLFALQIRRWLGPGAEADGAGWDVPEPKPIPPQGGDPRIPTNAPSDIRHGDSTGLTLRAKNLPKGFGENTAAAALRDALAFGREGGGAIIMLGDSTLPDDHFIIVIGQKQ